MKLANLFLLGTLLLTTSCASYIDNLYRDLDRNDRQLADADGQDSYGGDQFDQYRKNTKRRTSTEYNKPGRNRGNLSTNDQRSLEPQIKRQYQDEKVANKRVTASDLTDNGSDGSLWSTNDQSAFLFSTAKSKSAGDIVQINVLPRLKNEITLELKRAYPENPYEAKARAEGLKNNAAAGAPADTTASNDPKAEADAAPYDKISGVIVEEINREHLLIKGRKSVLYKNRKRMIEVQALISRRDITDEDAINSDTILESTVTVVR